jgi:hypothetical protein
MNKINLIKFINVTLNLNMESIVRCNLIKFLSLN